MKYSVHENELSLIFLDDSVQGYMHGVPNSLLPFIIFIFFNN